MTFMIIGYYLLIGLAVGVCLSIVEYRDSKKSSYGQSMISLKFHEALIAIWLASLFWIITLCFILFFTIKGILSK